MEQVGDRVAFETRSQAYGICGASTLENNEGRSMESGFNCPGASKLTTQNNQRDVHFFLCSISPANGGCNSRVVFNKTTADLTDFVIKLPFHHIKQCQAKWDKKGSDRYLILHGVFYFWSLHLCLLFPFIQGRGIGQNDTKFGAAFQIIHGALPGDDMFPVVFKPFFSYIEEQGVIDFRLSVNMHW